MVCALERRAPLFKSDVVVSDAVPDQFHFAAFDCLSSEPSTPVDLVDVADCLAVLVDLSDQRFRCRFLLLNPVHVAVFGGNPAAHLTGKHLFHFAAFLDHVHRILVVFSSA